MPIINKNIIVYPHLDWDIEFENESALYKHVDKVIKEKSKEDLFYMDTSVPVKL